MDRKCKVCEEKLFGRSDQKFCSDHCRSHFHNIRWKQIRKERHKIHAFIKRNREILAAFVKEGIRSVTLESLMRNGLDPSYLTRLEHFEEGPPVTWCYDIGYMKNPDETITIILEDDRKNSGCGNEIKIRDNTPRALPYQ